MQLLRAITLLIFPFLLSDPEGGAFNQSQQLPESKWDSAFNFPGTSDRVEVSVFLPEGFPRKETVYDCWYLLQNDFSLTSVSDFIELLQSPGESKIQGVVILMKYKAAGSDSTYYKSDDYLKAFSSLISGEIITSVQRNFSFLQSGKTQFLVSVNRMAAPAFYSTFQLTGTFSAAAAFLSEESIDGALGEKINNNCGGFDGRLFFGGMPASFKPDPAPWIDDMGANCKALLYRFIDPSSKNSGEITSKEIKECIAWLRQGKTDANLQVSH